MDEVGNNERDHKHVPEVVVARNHGDDARHSNGRFVVLIDPKCLKLKSQENIRDDVIFEVEEWGWLCSSVMQRCYCSPAADA